MNTKSILTKKQVATHFGSGAKAARALGITRQYFYLMPDPLPPQWAALAQVKSGGKLMAFHPDAAPQPQDRAA